MSTRIREQLERVPDLKTKCTLTITVAPVELPPAGPDESLEQQVQAMSDRVSEMIFTNMERKQLRAPANTIPTRKST
jgi:peptide subunit release factor 1 (eRF1)